MGFSGTRGCQDPVTIPRGRGWELPCACALTAPAKAAHCTRGRGWQSSLGLPGAWQGPAPTVGLGSGSCRGHSPDTPPSASCPGEHTHTSGRAQSSLPGRVAPVATRNGPRGCWQGSAQPLCSAALPWGSLGPAAIMDLSGRAIPGRAITTSELREDCGESPGTVVSSCKALQGWHRPLLVTAGVSLNSWESSSCLILEGVTSG